MRYKTRLLFSYSSMNEQGLGRPTRTCDLGVSLCVWLVPPRTYQTSSVIDEQKPQL